MGNRQCGMRDEQWVSGEWSLVRGDERWRTDRARDEQGVSGLW